MLGWVKVPLMSNTFELFVWLLTNFESLLGRARHLRTTNAEDALAVKAAVVGFSLFSPLPRWGRAHFEIIDSRLQGELSPHALQCYEQAAEPIAIFSCLALGSLLGKFEAGQIDEAEFLLGDAHLAGFVALHNEEICARFVA